MCRPVSILGDSILMGATLDQKGKYRVVRQNPEEIEKTAGIRIQNLCHMGYTTDKAVGKALADRICETRRKQTVLIEYGGNDCDFNWKEISDDPYGEHRCRVPLEKFRENYRKLIGYVRKKGCSPVAVSLFPVDSERYFKWFCKGGVIAENVLTWLKDIHVIYRWQEMYSAAVCQIAREESIPLIDLRAPFLAIHNMKECLCEDGIHPSEYGQRLICRTVLEQLKGIAPV